MVAAELRGAAGREKGTALTTSGTVDRAWLHEPGAHRLLVADTDDHRRIRAAAWVAHELARGAKVYYKGWLPGGRRPDQHWLAGPAGAPGADHALASGQLEFLDFPTVIERANGTAEGLLHLLTGECERAIADGWPTVAMSQESAHRPMADATEVADFTAQERSFDILARRWPLTTLCQLTIDEENPNATWETAALHHRAIADAHWSTSYQSGRWHLRGALDAHISVRLDAALSGALNDTRHSPEGPDLHIDLSAVRFMDFACARILLLKTRTAPDRSRVILHGATPFVRRLIIAAGRPRTVLFEDEAAAW